MSTLSAMENVGTSVTGDCGCGCGGSGGCSELVGLERTRFFARQLVGPDDLTQDQTYFREKSRRHNRLLHGWGIVCGAGVKKGSGDCEVVVQQGYVLGPYGDEIVIDHEVTLDICKEDPTGAAFDPCGGVDPWCVDVSVQRPAGQTLYLAVRYADCDTRPVRVTACGCGCDDAECEYSRTRDSFELKVLTRLPDNYSKAAQAAELAGLSLGSSRIGSLMSAYGNYLPAEEWLQVLELFSAFACLGGGRSCPPCPASPWVILADLEVDASGTVTVACAPHRRYIVSFGAYSFHCASDPKDESQVTGTKKNFGERQLLIQTGYAATAAAPPAASVAAKAGDGGWLTIPGNFSVLKSDTVGHVIAREGDTAYVDSRTGDTATLRELYAAAGADPNAKVDSVAEALAPLEGAKIDVAGLRVVRSAYEGLLDKHGLDHLDETYAGSPAAAAKLPAPALRGVETESAVGKYLAGKTVAEVAAMPQDEFVAVTTKGLRTAQRETEVERAKQVWAAASRVTKLSGAWGS